MDRTKFACLCLLGSFFVLAGLLAVKLPTLVPSAQASLLEDKGRFTLMTAPTRGNGAESLFVLDQTDEVLLIYDVDLSRRPATMSRMRVIPLAPLFGTGKIVNPGGGRPHP